MITFIIKMKYIILIIIFGSTSLACFSQGGNFEKIRRDKEFQLHGDSYTEWRSQGMKDIYDDKTCKEGEIFRFDKASHIGKHKTCVNGNWQTQDFKWSVIAENEITVYLEIDYKTKYYLKFKDNNGVKTMILTEISTKKTLPSERKVYTAN
jgi:hypothetical protein